MTIARVSRRPSCLFWSAECACVKREREREWWRGCLGGPLHVSTGFPQPLTSRCSCVVSHRKAFSWIRLIEYLVIPLFWVNYSGYIVLRMLWHNNLKEFTGKGSWNRVYIAFWAVESGQSYKNKIHYHACVSTSTIIIIIMSLKGK
jgi:hypothetical protein